MTLSTLRSLWVAIALLVTASIAQAAEPIPLRAGPVTMLLDADNVFLRYIKVGPHEVLRGINAPIRNQKWSTVAPKVSNLHVERSAGGFKATFDVVCAENDLDFRWKGTITGNDQGTIEFTFDGQAHSTFKRNRIGFCVLHAASAAGQSWTLETVDGKTSDGHFPKYISPHQPAKNLKAITHDVAPGIRARVDFEGEIFEMEDQRNWTDASFKTYCTPLAIPYPVEVAKGTKIHQKLKISLAGDLASIKEQAAADGRTSGAVLTLGKQTTTLPRLGLQLSNEVNHLTDLQVEHLKALHLDHLSVELVLSCEECLTELRDASEQAKALGVSLHVYLNVGEAPAYAKLLEVVRELKPPVSYWLVTDGEPARFAKAREELEPILGMSKIGVSRTTNFVELNRARPEDKSIAAVGFAINPQIHAFDNASMVETLPIHADAVNSARQFAGNLPLVIGPITLRPQLVNGKVAPGGPPFGRFPIYVDTRQGTDFAAAWTLGSLKSLAESNAASATYFETVGWNGIMDADNVASRPKGYPSRPGELFPIYQLLREVGEFAGGTVRQVDSSDTLAAVGLALRKPGQLRLLVGNLSGQPQTITVRGMGDGAVTMRSLNGDLLQAEPDHRISLPPYGIVSIDQATE